MDIKYCIALFGCYTCGKKIKEVKNFNYTSSMYKFVENFIQ